MERRAGTSGRINVARRVRDGERREETANKARRNLALLLYVSGATRYGHERVRRTAWSKLRRLREGCMARSDSSAGETEKMSQPRLSAARAYKQGSGEWRSMAIVARTSSWVEKTAQIPPERVLAEPESE